MKIRYIIQNLQEKLEGELTLNEKIYFDGFTVLPTSLKLTTHKEYIVLGVEYLGPGLINYMIVDDTQVSFPKFYPGDFFEIVDHRTSKYWINAQVMSMPEDIRRYPTLISFKEAVNCKDFFNDLIEGEMTTIEIFDYNKFRIENEFPDDLLSYAELITDGWMMCPICRTVWENISTQGIIQCPNNHSSNNPSWAQAKDPTAK